MKFINRIYLITCIGLAFFISGCDKTKPYDIAVAPAQAHFAGEDVQKYSVVGDPAPVYNITIGTTDVASVDRVVTYNVSSPTGAVAGTQYTIDNSGSVTIPAGKATASIDIRGNSASYLAGREDTLVLSLTTPSLEVAAFQDTVLLLLSGCSNAQTNLNDLMGDYENTIETLATNPPYGPYHTSISSVNQTSATTGTIVVENIFDDGWGPITFDLDWTDPNNSTLIVEPQAAVPGSNAGAIVATYNGQTVAVKAPSAVLSPTPGTFSYCDQKLVLKMQLGVTGMGFFNALYTVNLQR